MLKSTFTLNFVIALGVLYSNEGSLRFYSFGADVTEVGTPLFHVNKYSMVELVYEIYDSWQVYAVVVVVNGLTC